MKCRFCGSEVANMRGVTGRVTVCHHCGWGRMELTERLKSLGAAGQLELVQVGRKGQKAAGITW